MPLTIKICGITTVEDARMVLAENIDYIGVNLWSQSPRAVTQDQAREISGVLPEGKRVMVNVSPESALLRAFSSDFDYFQLHFSVEHATDLVPLWADTVGVEKLWLAPRLPENDPLPDELLGLADTFLIDAASKDAFGGTGKTANWSRFKALKDQHPDKTFILAGGLGPENITEAITQSTTSFVDINSGIESAPGKKEQSRLQELIQALNR